MLFRSGDFFLGGQSFVINISGKAARTIAALLDLAAIRIEYAIGEQCVGGFGRLDDQQLIETDAEMPIGPLPDLFWIELDGLIDGVDDHEIVAQSVHFGEVDCHVLFFGSGFNVLNSIGKLEKPVLPA